MYNRVVLESHPPAKPVVSAAPAITATPLFPLVGTKEAHTSIWINGQKKVDLSTDTAWSAEINLNPGSNLLSIVARNADGIESSPLILPVILDNVAPTVEQKTPAAEALLNQPNPTISFKLSDLYSALDLTATTAAAFVTADGQPVAGTWSASGNNTVVFTPMALPAGISTDGAYSATIQPTDALGNASTATLTFTIDTTPPLAPVIDLPPGPVAAAITLTGTHSADAATLSITSTSGSVGTVTYPSATTWQVTLSGLAEGEVPITVTVIDAAGNRSPSVAAILVVDTTPPTVPTVNAIDSPATVATLLLDGGKEIESTLFVNGRELSGSLDSLADTFTGGSDTPAPVTGDKWLVNEDSAVGTIRRVGDQLDIDLLPNPSTILRPEVSLGSTYQLRGDFDVQVDYSNLIINGREANLGLRISSPGIMAYVGPYVTANNEPGMLFRDSQVVTQLQKFVEIGNKLDGTLRITRTGNVVTLLYEDSAQYAVVDENYGADDVEIAIVYLQGVGADLNSSVKIDNFQVNAADSILHNDEIIDGRDGASFFSSLWTTTVLLNEGTNTFTLYAQDSAGNRSADAIVTVVRDTTAPVLAVATPSSGSSVVAAGSIVVTLADGLSAVDLVASLTGATVKDNAGSEVLGSWGVVGSTLVFTPFATLADQAYTVTLHPVDTLGNSGSVVFAFTVDSAVPAVTAMAMSLESPHRAETVSFTLTFSEAMKSVVAPSVKLVKAGLLFDTVHIVTGSWSGTTIWRGSFTFTSSSGDGDYSVTVAGAQDIAGNSMASQSVGTFVLDTTAPVGPTLNPVASPTRQATQVLSGAKPVATALFINGQQKVALNDETTWSLSYPLKEGTNSLSLVSRDAAGNDSSPLTASLLLDTTPPAFTIDLWQPVSSQPTQTLSGSREPGSIVKLDGTVIVAAEDLSGSWSTPVTLVEGIATRLTFTVSDGLGNSVTRTVDVLYDALAPPALVAGALSADGNGSGSSVKLTWPAYVEPADLAYYRIYQSTANFTDIGGRIAVGSVNKGSKSYTALGLTEGTNYFFAVEPVDISGNSESAVHTAAAIPVDAAAPEEVTGLKAVASYSAPSGNSVTLTWTASKNSRGDLAEQFLYVDAGLGYAVGTPLGQSVVSHSVTGLADATLYKFKVTTRDVGGHESAGTIVQAFTRLANPTGLVAVAGKNQVTLHWNAVASPYLASYQVYRLASEQSQADVAAMTPVKSLTATDWIDSGLSNGTIYQYAVTARNSSGAERTEVGSVAATPRQDATGPVIGTFSLAAGQVIAAPLTVEAVASDLESAMTKVELYLDGVLVATGNGAAVSWYWNVVTATDGNHTLTVVAFDALGNSSEASRSVVVSLAPPITPRLTTHLIEKTVPQTTVTASGSDALDTTVTIKVNGVVVGSSAAGASGNFAFSGLALVEGENRLAVKATHRGGDSPWSADYRITVDSGAPPSPIALAAKALAGGSVQFTWQVGSGEAPTGYNLYSANSAFTTATAAGVSRVNTAPINYLFKEIIPAGDSERFYAVTALDGAGNESPLSNLVASAADRSLPTVSSLLFTFNQAPRPLDLAFGPGQAGVALTLSEPLKELPFFSLEPTAGSPIVISLSKTDELHYSGSFRIDATSPHGPTTWKFSGKDAIGNRGNQQGSGPILDVRGPAATVSAPVALQQIVSAVAVAISFDEAPVATPVLEFRDSAGVIVPVTGLVSTGDALHWAGTIDLSALAEGEGTFKLLSASDAFGNLSTTVVAGQKLLLYRDAPPAPAIPQGLTAIAKAGGHIELLWKAVTGASSYRLYRRVAGEGDFTLLAEQSATGYADLPDSDGSYSYAVSAVGLLASESALSTEVTVTADRAAPSAPTDLALVLAGSGIQANWSAPAGDPPAASYRLYRAAASFSSVAGLSAVATSEVPAAIDAGPSSTLRHYVVTALDSLGNESVPTASVTIDFPVAPVKNLVLSQLEGGKPSITWEAPQGGLQGYFIYRNGEKVVAAPTPGTSYTDGYYNGGSVSYGISALDAYGNESPIRELTLPELAIGLPAGTTLRRGLLETVPVVLTSAEATTVKEIRLKVGSSAESLLAGPFALSAGTALTVQKIAATPLDAGNTVAVVGTAILEPAPGTTLRLTRTSVAQVTPAGSALEIFNEPLIRGTTASVRLKVNNLGSARMEFLTSENGASTGQVIVYLKNQDGNILAEGRLDQRTGSQVVNSASYTSARIEPGASFLSEPIVFRVPESAPYAVVLEAVIGNSYYHYSGSDQVSAPGMRQSTALSIADVSYSAVAQADKDIYRQGESVVLSGQALATGDGGPMPNVPVRLGLSLKGFDRFFTLNTDDTGAFRYVFTPAINEAGSYSVWAVHPELQSRTAQDTFNIYALTVSPQRFDLKLARGTSYDISVTLRNYSGIELTGLSFDATVSSGLSATVINAGDNLLGGDEAQTIKLRVSALANTPNTGYVKLDVTTAEGLGGVVDVNASMCDTIPIIAVSPSYIDTGLMRGTQKVATLTIKNTGYATLNNARVTAPSKPWMSLTVPLELGSLAVGQSGSVGVLFQPDIAVPSGIYDDRIVITADNHIPYTVNLQATVTSDAFGNVVFDVLNELFDDVVGANLTLQHQSLPELLYTLKTGADGTVSKFDIPEGRYSYSVSANGHKSYSGSFVVTPGLTVTVPVALEVTLVEIEWSVTETTIEDRYEIKLQQTFQTNVPTSVLVVEPPGITLPDMQPGEVFNGEFSITNYGLIKADYKGMRFPASIDDYDIEVLGNIPMTLGAMEKVIVPYRVMRRAEQ